LLNMKTVKNLLNFCLITFIMFGCVQEDDFNSELVDGIAQPINVSAAVSVTQDNTGLVTITPLGEGVTGFTLNYGDGSEVSEWINPGGSIDHVYAEGSYELLITAYGLNDITTEATQTVMVSFQAPQNLVVTIENDAAVSKQVNVNATAEFALTYEVDFGETGVDPISGNDGETVSHVYQNPGIYTITVTSMSAAIETLTYTEEFEVTAIVQPLESAPTPPARAEADVISIYSAAYTDVEGTNYFPDWGQGGQGSAWATFDLNGDEMLQYINLSYQGIALADGTSVDVSGMEFLHLDVWTADVVTDIETSLINNAGGTVTEAPIVSALSADSWTSIEIPISDYTDQGLTVSEIFQLKFVGTPWATGTVFIDNIYFYKSPTATATGLTGTWKFVPEAGALGVGPSVGDTSWWNCDGPCVVERACYYDDEYVFGADGSFTNILGSDTWVEGWQGGSDNCGAPVAPHDGSANATYVYNEVAGTVTINGIGAYIGLPKANNQGELPNVGVPSSITYDITFLDPNTISVTIEAGTGAGVFWQYKLAREGAATSPFEGTWQMAPEAGALGVGPAVGDTSWWNCDDACVTSRACYYDDQYVFTGETFSNILGTDSWIEGWQGGGDACGTPVAPYDGSASATFSYDAGAGTLTINGTGAYIGLPKANNQGELPNVAVPDAITYNVSFIDANTISVHIEAGAGAGVFWQYKLVKI